MSIEKYQDQVAETVRHIYEGLPKTIGMHFTQAGQVPLILSRGFVPSGHRDNFFFTFDKEETDEFYGDKLERLKAAGLDKEHYGARETLERFHQAFKTGFNGYGLERLPVSLGEDIRGYIRTHQGLLPAVVFVDLSDLPVSHRGKSPRSLPQGYLSGVPAERILKVVTLGDEDVDNLVQKISQGSGLADSLRQAFITKTDNWLMGLGEVNL